MGVSLNELGKIAEKDRGEIDRKIDDEVKKAGEQDKIVVDSRLAFHWMPESFKVLMRELNSLGLKVVPIDSQEVEEEETSAGPISPDELPEDVETEETDGGESEDDQAGKEDQDEENPDLESIDETDDESVEEVEEAATDEKGEDA